MRDSRRLPIELRSWAHELVLPLEGTDTSRRTFLKLAGFGVTAATLAACGRAPTKFVVPRLDETAHGPGQSYWIATSCDGCTARCGVLARCRDGRPTKLEGNPDHLTSRGGLCAAGQAGLLELYDSRRFDGPQLAGESSDWDALDAAVRERLASAGDGLRILSGTVTSPSLRASFERLVERHGGRHVEWDPNGSSGLLAAHESCLGTRRPPRPRLDRAKVIASFDCDFLGPWLDPVGLPRDWAAGRTPDEGTMSRHVQFESRLSVTGGKADRRVRVAPHELRPLLESLCAELAERAGVEAPIPVGTSRETDHPQLHSLAGELWDARGEGLVLCGSEDPGTQALALFANHLLGAFGTTLDTDRRLLTSRSDDAALLELIDELRAGKVEVLVLHDTNPVFDLPASLGLAELIASVPFVVGTAMSPDETTNLAHAVAPRPHALEAWDDAESVSGRLSLTQPTVPALKKARGLRTTLAAWLGETTDERRALTDWWRRRVHPRVGGGRPFQGWFDNALRRGHVDLGRDNETLATFDVAALKSLLEGGATLSAPESGRLAVVLHANAGLPSGRHAHNPWLQELPDPVTKLVWDNVAVLSEATAKRLGITAGDVVRVSAEGVTVELPAWVQPGQHDDVVSLALGYGREGTDRFTRIGPRWLEERVMLRPGDTVGTRVEDLLIAADGALSRSGGEVQVEPTGESVVLACTQDHHRLEVPKHLAPANGEVRDVVRTTSLATLIADPAHAVASHHHEVPGLWPEDHGHPAERWGLAIDLSACIGCSGCAVSCTAENNVPVVGKDEVARHREMTWMRIDRYFHGEGDDLRVAHQPMMCQHCAHAPCETVCPVLATAHSSDGLNQQVYNRCVGTRYCANNCPFKVRRFNWFDYPRDDDLRNLALNPDVTVRTRGVMEKCSMCVQRIQEARAEAVRRGAPVQDGEIQTACQQSCPTRAIHFGDLNDPESDVSQAKARARAYTPLGELNLDAGVTYLAEVVNSPDAQGAHHD